MSSAPGHRRALRSREPTGRTVRESCGPGPRLRVVLDRHPLARRAAPVPRRCGRTGSRAFSSAAPKSVSQRTASSLSIVRAPLGPSTAKPWFWLMMWVRPGGQVPDRVVGAVVAERQLVGLEADGAAEQLVTEADPVNGQLADELADRLDDVVERRRGRPGRWPGRSRPGRSASSSAALDVHGWSSTVAPRATQVAGRSTA